jgi:hypothetical protein
MMFDGLLELVKRRIATCHFAHLDDIVLAESVLVEAAALWRAAQPESPDCPTPQEERRLAEARRVLGLLYCLRFFALPDGPDRIELARVVVLLQPVVHIPDEIPEPLHMVLGASADPAIQVAEGSRMLNDAKTAPDPLLLDAAVILLTAAVAAMADDHPGGRGHRRSPQVDLSVQPQYRRT